MTPREWADLAYYRFGRFGSVSILTSDDDWQRWASDLCAITKLRQQSPPDPYSFETFEPWAQAFDQIITIGD